MLYNLLREYKQRQHQSSVIFFLIELRTASTVGRHLTYLVPYIAMVSSHHMSTHLVSSPLITSNLVSVSLISQSLLPPLPHSIITMGTADLRIMHLDINPLCLYIHTYIYTCHIYMCVYAHIYTYICAWPASAVNNSGRTGRAC